MKILIGTTPVNLDFSNRGNALITRACIVMAYEEIGMNGWYGWESIKRKYNYIKRSYQSATQQF